MGFFSSIGDTLSSLGPVVSSGGLSTVLGPAGSLIGGAAGDLSSTGSNYAYDNTIANMNQSQLDFANKNLQFQEDYAKNGLSWRVSDAANSGLSPLVGAGAAPTGGAVVAPPPMEGPSMAQDDNSLSSSMSKMGQGIDRALASAQSADDRAMREVQMRRLNADADFAETQAKSAKLSLMRQTAKPNPAVPSSPSSDYQKFVDRDGNVYYGPSPESAQSAHGTLFGPSSYFVRNSIIGPAGDMLSIPFNEARYAVGTAEQNNRN